MQFKLLNPIMGKNAVNIGQNYFHGYYSHNVVKIVLVCTRFHNEKGDITTTQEDFKQEQANGVPN